MVVVVMGWGEDEGLPTLCHGAFLGIVLAGAIFDHSVDDVVFETRVVSMECTRRLWECILAGGFKPPDNDRSDFGALLRAIQEAAKMAPNQNARIIRAADLAECEMAPLPGDPAPLVPVGPPRRVGCTCRLSAREPHLRGPHWAGS